jgi:hypothetical protein
MTYFCSAYLCNNTIIFCYSVLILANYPFMFYGYNDLTMDCHSWDCMEDLTPRGVKLRLTLWCLVKGCRMWVLDTVCISCILCFSCMMYIDSSRHLSWLLSTTCDLLHPVIRIEMWRMIILWWARISIKLYCNLVCFSLGWQHLHLHLCKNPMNLAII